MHLWDGDWHMGWMWILWVLLIVVVVAALRGPLGGSPPEPPRESPEQTVKRRYAAGEIDREEYERVLSDLRK